MNVSSKAAKVSIVVADDHELVRRGISSLLAGRRGWKVCAEADNGEEALGHAARLRPDIAILDVSMPGMDGLKTAELIRTKEEFSHVRTIPIIALTADVIANNRSAYFTAGVKEVRAWTVKQGASAPEAAGVIHTDFQKGFIRAEVIAYDDYVSLGGEQGAKDAGKMRAEGKEYVVKDGDVMNFLFNV